MIREMNDTLASIKYNCNVWLFVETEIMRAFAS